MARRILRVTGIEMLLSGMVRKWMASSRIRSSSCESQKPTCYVQALIIDLRRIRQSCENSRHMDTHNRARFESLINDQLAQEEPKAPRIRLKDPTSNLSCPPFNFVYTNRLI